MKIEGYVSKKIVRKMLDNYHTKQKRDRSFKEYVTSSSLNVDGKSGADLDKIIIDQSVEKLPDIVRACCRARWYYKTAVRHTCNVLGITVNEYYSYCNEAIDLIYRDINGSKVGMKALFKAINS